MRQFRWCLRPRVRMVGFATCIQTRWSHPSQQPRRSHGDKSQGQGPRTNLSGTLRPPTDPDMNRHHRGPVGGAVHPRRGGLQHHLHRAPIQAAPPTPPLTAVIPAPCGRSGHNAVRPRCVAAPAPPPACRRRRRRSWPSNSSNSMSSITVRWSTPSSARNSLTLRTSLPAPSVTDLRQARHLKRQRRAPSQINKPTHGSVRPDFAGSRGTRAEVGDGCCCGIGQFELLKLDCRPRKRAPIW